MDYYKEFSKIYNRELLGGIGIRCSDSTAENLISQLDKQLKEQNKSK